MKRITTKTTGETGFITKTAKLVDADNKDDGTFTMSRKGNTYVFNLPMYTRAKQMITSTGYTGNNPYVAYRRKPL